MNLRERLTELGYHVSGYDLQLKVYLHGKYLVTFKRFERNDPWTNNCFGGYNPISITNIELEMNKIMGKNNEH